MLSEKLLARTTMTSAINGEGGLLELRSRMETFRRSDKDRDSLMQVGLILTVPSKIQKQRCVVEGVHGLFLCLQEA